MPQSPTRQVHAVLGNLAPARTATENQNHANLTRFYNEFCFSPMTKNADLQTPWRFKDRTQTNQNADFAKPDFDRKLTTPTKPTKFYKLNLPETLPIKATPISRAYETDRELCQRNRHNLSKPMLTKT